MSTPCNACGGTGRVARSRFSPATRRAVCDAADGRPLLGFWLHRISLIGDSRLTSAIDGVWTGLEGRATLDLPDTGSMLCVGWYNGFVEWSYIS